MFLNYENAQNISYLRSNGRPPKMGLQIFFGMLAKAHGRSLMKVWVDYSKLVYIKGPFPTGSQLGVNMRITIQITQQKLVDTTKCKSFVKVMIFSTFIFHSVMKGIFLKRTHYIIRQSLQLFHQAIHHQLFQQNRLLINQALSLA